MKTSANVVLYIFFTNVIIKKCEWERNSTHYPIFFKYFIKN